MSERCPPFRTYTLKRLHRSSDQYFVIKWNDVWHICRPSSAHPRLIETAGETFTTRKAALEFLDTIKDPGPHNRIYYR